MQWEEGDLHGRHVRPDVDVPGAIKWEPAVKRPRVRVRDSTCECMPVVYELCIAGGLFSILKITRVGGRAKVEEFTTRPNSRVRDLWESLCEGDGQDESEVSTTREYWIRHGFREGPGSADE